MEFEENKDEEIEQQYTEEDYVDIYSKRAILWFSILFDVIFGGVLLIINLRNAGYKKAAIQVLFFSIFYYILTVFVISVSGIRVDAATLKKASTGVQLNATEIKTLLSLAGLTLILKIAGGLVLTQYFFKRYFPDDDYYPKPIWRAVMISLLISMLAGYILPFL
ncbi:hypothetical protein [Mucilaginibacter sp. SP1R1]|uniref:hypothetical protein n=1 Tax=Mucilaginibacter sp. SP1R1 TaxID=2723091 RepID=UPI00161DCBDE|nr:hypothetical protein [Mucilaginibacter sp. SP1R1]MBB6149712.1 hypothetical protein [Mucilaginibacter sp. SP1R1]